MLKRSEWLSFGETAAFAMTGDLEFAISVDEPRGALFEGQLADWHMIEDDEGNRRPFRSLDMAEEAMLAALRSGLVRAIGVPAGRGDASPSPINAIAWSSLRLDVRERETVAFEADLEAFSGLRFQFVDVARHLEPPIVVGTAKLRPLRVVERSVREASFLAEMAESDDEPFPVEDEAELEAGRIAMSLPVWTLNQALAWIATRKPEAVGRDEGELGVSVWMAFEVASGRPIDFPLQRPGDAWRHLASALAQKKLIGFATHVRMSRVHGIVQHSLGMPFPPEGQAGFALGCSVFDGDRAIVAPTDRVLAASWDEFHDLTFARADVMHEFPADTVAIETEFERRPDQQSLASSMMIKSPLLPSAASVVEPDLEAAEIKLDPRLPDVAIPSNSQRGRPSVYPWVEFDAEALRKLEYEGGVGATTNFIQADLELHMAEWCEANWERCPAESTARERVAKVRKAFEAGRGR